MCSDSIHYKLKTHKNPVNLFMLNSWEFKMVFKLFSQQQQQQQHNNFIYRINMQRRRDCSANSIASLGGTVLQNNYKNLINLQEETYIIFKQIVPNH